LTDDRTDERTPGSADAVRWLTPLVAPALLVVGVTALATLSTPGIQNTTNLMLINLLVVLALYTFSGNSGVLSFGHVGFMAIGAYACALLTIPEIPKNAQLPKLPDFIGNTVLPTVPAVLVAALFAMVLAYLVAVPLMRLSGLSAVIATLSLLVIVNVVISHWDAVTKGQLTLVGTPTDTTLWGTVLWVLAALVIAYLYQRSRSGLRLRASREDPQAALSVGISIAHDRRLSFALSAGMAAVAGALYGHLLGTFAASSFYFDTTFLTLAMLVVGGINSLAGAVVGTIVVAALAELFRQLEAGANIASLSITLPNGSQQIVLAILLLVILIFRPNGIMGGREFQFRAPPRLRRVRRESRRTREAH
jgi:branched-chain amino acid transport system permease protein